MRPCPAQENPPFCSNKSISLSSPLPFFPQTLDTFKAPAFPGRRQGWPGQASPSSSVTTSPRCQANTHYCLAAMGRANGARLTYWVAWGSLGSKLLDEPSTSFLDGSARRAFSYGFCNSSWAPACGSSIKVFRRLLRQNILLLCMQSNGWRSWVDSAQVADNFNSWKRR